VERLNPCFWALCSFLVGAQVTVVLITTVDIKMGVSVDRAVGEGVPLAEGVWLADEGLVW